MMYIPQKMPIGKCMQSVRIRTHESVTSELIRAHVSTASLGNAVRKQFGERFTS